MMRFVHYIPDRSIYQHKWYLRADELVKSVATMFYIHHNRYIFVSVIDDSWEATSPASSLSYQEQRSVQSVDNSDFQETLIERVPISKRSNSSFWLILAQIFSGNSPRLSKARLV